MTSKWWAVMMLGLTTPMAAQAALEQPLLVGTYTKGSSEGIYQLTLDEQSGELSQPRLLAKGNNPSYLAMQGNELVLAANETAPGQLSVFRWEEGRLSLAQQLDSGGRYGCHLALHPDGDRLALAHYGGGIAQFHQHNGQWQAQALSQYPGQGPNPDRQEAPHPHWVSWSPDGQHLYSIDLGTDQVLLVDPKGEVSEALKLQPGDGPRHGVFSDDGNTLYILNELSNTLVVAARDSESGQLQAQQRLDTLPAEFDQHSQAAAIKRAGNKLYVSNRGHNSLALFQLAEDGQARLVQHRATEGDWPRDFTLTNSGRWLVVANERSDSLVSFALDEQGHIGAEVSRQTLSTPVFVSPATPGE